MTESDDRTTATTDSVAEESTTAARKAKPKTKFKVLVRRVHLYAGLFLLPWVFLYGITGAMFNHIGLFPETVIRDVPAASLADTALSQFPSPDALAEQVVAAINKASPDAKIELVPASNAAFNNPVILEVHDDELRHDVYIDPVSKHADVVTNSKNPEVKQPLLKDVRTVQIEPNPYSIAKKTVPDVLREAGISATNGPKPRGWCKLNFLANVDGQPARVTYVLRNGHVDVAKHKGEDGMTPRAFFMRLHTSHGQPPHWNGRRVWSVFVDIMAIAMVTWGLTGLFMWWQLKRTRMVGGLVIAASLATAATLYFAMMNYYAVTVL